MMSVHAGESGELQRQIYSPTDTNPKNQDILTMTFVCMPMLREVLQYYGGDHQHP
jgi:hypothetical protein